MDRTLIIAEAGVNHNGSVDMAKALVDAAAEAGADYVKFQTFKADNLVAKAATLAEYQRINLGVETESQYEMLKKLQLNENDFLEIMEYCRIKGIKFLSTAFDLWSIDFLASLHLDFWKIPSGEITNFPYLRAIGKRGGKVVMSTGMCTPADIEAAISVLVRFGIKRSDITLLHCNTEYPTPMNDVNLRAMLSMREAFGLDTGYSDHTVGIEVPIAAVALGAKIIEKHFTLDRNLPGPDHAASLDPHDLKAMVSAIRNIEDALGSPEKEISESERRNLEAARKSIVASGQIRAGEILGEHNLCAKRPGYGISPMRWDEVVGRAAPRDFNPDELIEI